MLELDPKLLQFLIIISLMIISFIFEIVPMEVTALGTVGLLLICNIIIIISILYIGLIYFINVFIELYIFLRFVGKFVDLSMISLNNKRCSNDFFAKVMSK